MLFVLVRHGEKFYSNCLSSDYFFLSSPFLSFFRSFILSFVLSFFSSFFFQTSFSSPSIILNFRATWLVLSVEDVTLDFRVVTSSPALGIEITLSKMFTKKKKIQRECPVSLVVHRSVSLPWWSCATIMSWFYSSKTQTLP